MWKYKMRILIICIMSITFAGLFGVDEDTKSDTLKTRTVRLEGIRLVAKRSKDAIGNIERVEKSENQPETRSANI